MNLEHGSETPAATPHGHGNGQAKTAAQPTWHDQYGLRRVYETTRTDGGGFSLRLGDRLIELGPKEYGAYQRVAEWLPGIQSQADLEAQTGMDAGRLGRFLGKLADAGLLYRRAHLPAQMSGAEFHQIFNEVLPSWLAEGFSHPFWDRMMTGKGNARLFAGWMIELYHYTRNANRHMPLASAFGRTDEKTQRHLHARHYAEEWNHYHYFMKSLKEMGYNDKAVAQSVPLPMTLALSNFMRQAAREDILCYSICSAVLEGTTVDSRTYNEYYEKSVEHYGIPRSAIQPIYAHLDLDKQYQHKDLFEEILQSTQVVTAARASKILDYGQGLTEHIWLWTDNIEKYYGNEANAVPRQPLDPFLD